MAFTKKDKVLHKIISNNATNMFLNIINNSTDILRMHISFHSLVKFRLIDEKLVDNLKKMQVDAANAE